MAAGAPVSRGSLMGLVLMVLVISGASSWWAGRHDDRLGAEVAGLVKPGDIRMLSSTTCAICVVARQWFTSHEVPFEECFVELDAACAAELAASHSPGTPVLLVRGTIQVGFSPERLRDRLMAPS